MSQLKVASLNQPISKVLKHPHLNPRFTLRNHTPRNKRDTHTHGGNPATQRRGGPLGCASCGERCPRRAMRSGGTRCHCQVLFFHQGLAAWTVRTVRMSGERVKREVAGGNERFPTIFFWCAGVKSSFLVCWGKIIMKDMGRWNSAGDLKVGATFQLYRYTDGKLSQVQKYFPEHGHGNGKSTTSECLSY